MYIVTGGAGFIGSAFVSKLNAEGIGDILIVDELGQSEKWRNLVNLTYSEYMHKEAFMEALLADELPGGIEAIVHMGACSSTTESDLDFLIDNNSNYTIALAGYAVSRGIRFLYASSAATYGAGLDGYSDDHDKLEQLRPLNRYGYSKHLADLWLLRNGLLDRVAGLKFFNVFGPNEYHKEDMRSVVHKAWGQIKDSGKVRLFKSHRPDFADGEQKRDFVYIKDCLEVMWWLIKQPQVNGIFNLGSGQARSWKDLVSAVFSALGKKPQIEYFDMPEDIRGQYQYFTQAEMGKLRAAGYQQDFQSLEAAIRDYVVNFLESSDTHL